MRRHRHVDSLFSITLICAAATAQLDWRGIPRTPSDPAARQDAALACDHAAGGLLLFGGDNRADTWLWKAGVWKSLTPAQSPPGRWGHRMASDALRRRIVLFGGYRVIVTMTPFNDTWEWDGANWNQVFPTVSPAPRGDHAMTFDPVHGRTLLFGGVDYSTTSAKGWYRDTWEWDGAQWTQRFPANQPPWWSSEMVFDEARSVAVLRGGSGVMGTWEWNGNDWAWNYRTPTGNGAMAYDAARERVVWYSSGMDAAGNAVLGAVYEYDGITWTNRATASNPPPRYWHVMAFDPEMELLVVFGGRTGQTRLGDTWLLFPVHPATVAAFGAGCPGSGGILQIAADNLPWLGGSLRVRWSGYPALGSLVALAVGASNQTWLGLPLPLALGGLGMSGCSLFVSLDAIATTTAVSSLVTPLPVPANPALLGVDAFVQGFAFDRGANPGSMTTSNGLVAHIGAR